MAAKIPVEPAAATILKRARAPVSTLYPFVFAQKFESADLERTVMNGKMMHSRSLNSAPPGVSLFGGLGA
jgi:hypothetical protein